MPEGQEIITRLWEKAESIGAIKIGEMSPLSGAINQAFTLIGEPISGKKATEDEALAAALILHIRGTKKPPLTEDQVIQRLKVDRGRIQLLVKNKHAQNIRF